MKKAFTVAEGLVTLVIVGVLASVMISSVVKEKPDKNKIMIRNAYAQLTGVVNELVADSVLYPDFAEFGLADDTRATLNYGGIQFDLRDNRGKMCVGMRHYFNTITKGYIDDNVNEWQHCRASFYTKDGVKARFQINSTSAAHMDFKGYPRYIIMDVNPANGQEITEGVDLDTLIVHISRAGKLKIMNDDARKIINEAQIR